MARPYQPSLLRLLHGICAVVALLAWWSGGLVYSRFDGRWGRLPLELSGGWIDWHGTIGVLLLPLAVLFALYALSLGRRRLRRPANLIPLLALALAIGSGKLMDEDWLRHGELDHTVYGLHLLAWLLLALAMGWHLLGALRLGGVPLLVSMLRLQQRPGDGPADWPGQIRRVLAARSSNAP